MWQCTGTLASCQAFGRILKKMGAAKRARQSAAERQLGELPPSLRGRKSWPIDCVAFDCLMLHKTLAPPTRGRRWPEAGVSAESGLEHGSAEASSAVPIQKENDWSRPVGP